MQAAATTMIRGSMDDLSDLDVDWNRVAGYLKSPL
jgi:hypothetical protein